MHSPPSDRESANQGAALLRGGGFCGALPGGLEKGRGLHGRGHREKGGGPVRRHGAFLRQAAHRHGFPHLPAAGEGAAGGRGRVRLPGYGGDGGHPGGRKGRETYRDHGRRPYGAGRGHGLSPYGTQRGIGGAGGPAVGQAAGRESGFGLSKGSGGKGREAAFGLRPGGSALR